MNMGEFSHGRDWWTQNMQDRWNYITYAPEALLAPVLAFTAVAAIFRRWLVAFILSLVLLCMALAFYRGKSWLKPARDADVSADYMVSPCDGKVMRVSRLNGHVHIAIFLNIHNVHVQYAPLAGFVKSVTYKPGEFHPAYVFEKSRFNERMVTVLATRIGDVRIVQIAGLLARRIVSFCTPGLQLRRGDPLGLIKFGSRVDIVVPLDGLDNIVVKEGDRVGIGAPLALLRSAQE